MVTFDRGNATFRLSARGIAINDGRVLLQQIVGLNYWFLPGGATELFETCADALKREIREELHADVQIVRLVWVVENYFGMNNKLYHEHALFFLMALPQDSELLETVESAGEEDDGTKIINRWHGLRELRNLDVRPAFLGNGLQRLPDKTEYVIQRDIRGPN